MSTLPHGAIPFYGGRQPDLFEIERRCMDRDGKVIAYLDRHLPAGPVLDIGAGNGFTARRLSSAARRVFPLEPDSAMIGELHGLPWVRGVAQRLPYRRDAFAAAYATWAFYFTAGGTPVPGIDGALDELKRVVEPGGALFVVDNAGDDAFTALAPRDIGSDAAWWHSRGFTRALVRTSFRFDSVDEARCLLRFYFGDAATKQVATREIAYNVAIYRFPGN